MNKIKKLIYNYAVPAAGTLLNKKNKYINVIYYHDVIKGEAHSSQYVNVDVFKKHMEYIKNSGFTTYTFDELNKAGNISYGKKKLLITFDDGWVSNYTEIFEFMKQIGLKYNIYLTAGKIGKEEGYLTWEQVNEMYASGIVGFGAHTVNHPAMDNPESEGFADEITAANRIIEENLGFVPKDFCYPFGKYSEKSNEYMVSNTSYTRIYTSDLRFSYEKSGKIIFGRSSINSDESFAVFKHKVNGHFNVFSMIKR